MFSAARILAIRKRRGFSQEVLAEHSGVSLRTIQRVEQGETVPRGHTLQALATALGVSLEDFRPEDGPTTASAFSPGPSLAVAARPASAQPSPEPALETSVQLLSASGVVAAPAVPVLLSPLRPDPEFLQLLNLSALSVLVLPLLNIVVPFVLWRRQRHTILHAAEVGRRVLGFQILWQVGCFLAYVVVLLAYQAANALHLPLWRGGFLAVFILSYLLNLLLVGYYAGRLRRGDLAIYPIRL
ncbi:helix-turn-helix domain-containing protein [Hymenobacter rubripertinctus]|uniref:Helix-turn-helix domain-containing protein n=1 Tax=Hymenobacter rubripertinctus TaxID=2029981 RepID=A0A418QLZ5_9BACT|nr:helix-turn-helix domain-containing protein [Hymenobacter rubripertinctus]RIY06246.1 helix-turn-helix domain-containing protein [Hymenobacter rubripertinctus]